MRMSEGQPSDCSVGMKEAGSKNDSSRIHLQHAHQLTFWQIYATNLMVAWQGRLWAASYRQQNGGWQVLLQVSVMHEQQARLLIHSRDFPSLMPRSHLLTKCGEPSWIPWASVCFATSVAYTFCITSTQILFGYPSILLQRKCYVIINNLTILLVPTTIWEWAQESQVRSSHSLSLGGACRRLQVPC